jgi:hypothetical protein
MTLNDATTSHLGSHQTECSQHDFNRHLPSNQHRRDSALLNPDKSSGLSEKFLFPGKHISSRFSMVQRQGYLREQPQILRIVVRLRRVGKAVYMSLRRHYKLDLAQPGIHTLWLLRQVGDRHALIQEAISCRAAQLGLGRDCIDSHTGSPIVTHVPLNQSMKKS